MEMKQLEIFTCVAKNLSFSKAAEEMYISQPSVSSHISSLEKNLGTQLLIRNTKGVSLTKAGQDFLVYAQKILALREQALYDISGSNQSISGIIDIIASTIPVQHLLPEIISSFQKKWPNIVFSVEQVSSCGVKQAMNGFRYDFGMVGTIFDDDDRFNRRLIYDDELVLIYPNDTKQKSELIHKDFAKFLLSVPFIMRETGSGTRAEIEILLSKIGVELCDLRIPAYFPDTHSILLAVSHGMGVSLISKIAAEMYVDAGLVKMACMDSPLFRRQIYLLHSKALWLSPVQQAFADHAERYYCSTKAPGAKF